MASLNKPAPARRKFDKAFKTEALRMIDEGQFTAAVARALNVGGELLHTGKHAHRKQPRSNSDTFQRLVLLKC